MKGFLLLLLTGGSFLYYRYRSVSNKKVFFKSPFFVSSAGTLALLLTAILLVNLSAPESIRENDMEIQSDSLSMIAADTSARDFVKKGTGFHYDLILKAMKDPDRRDIIRLQAKYKHLCLSPDPSVSSLGLFGMGVISNERNNLTKARNYFNSVTKTTWPFLHYCKGEVLRKSNKYPEAEAEYRLEYENKVGNKYLSMQGMIRMYEELENYEKLYRLMQYPGSEKIFTDYLSRITLLHTWHFLSYTGLLFEMVLRRVNPIGFTAAMLISLLWLIYLFRLDIFNRERFSSLTLLFVAGSICSFMVFPVADFLSMQTDWYTEESQSKTFLYCFLLVGVPEEFAKFLPLLILLIFKGLEEPIDYLIYGCASALGFAFTENLIYFEEIKNGIIHGRAYLSVVGHMVDTSIIAYAMVVGRFRVKKKGAQWYLLPIGFLIASLVHGVYDYLIFSELYLVFFLFFILAIQVWIIMINNCINNSGRFTYKLATKAEESKIFMTLGLTSIFALEYVFSGFTIGVDQANAQFYSNLLFAGFFIIFFSSNLSSFDLIKGYWRKVQVTSHERRGYGNRPSPGVLIRWYFINAIQSHNYVGSKIDLFNDPYNKVLGEVLNGKYPAQIVNRIILYEDGIPDPYWFLIKMIRPIGFVTARPDYALIKLRYEVDSLIYEDQVQVHFKGITDAGILRHQQPEKNLFPFYGWAYIALTRQPQQIDSTSRIQL